MSTQKIWAGTLGRLEVARAEYRQLKREGRPLEAHSLMLSMYITLLSGQPVEGTHPVRFGIACAYHLLPLLLNWTRLSHNQLDVLLSPLVKMRIRFPVVSLFGFYDDLLCRIGKREVELAEGSSEAKPHQLALAHLTYANVLVSVGSLSNRLMTDTVRGIVTQVMYLGPLIAQEGPDIRGQLIRVHRKCAELLEAIGDRDDALAHAEVASNIAQSDLQWADQVPKVQVVVTRLRAALQ